MKEVKFDHVFECDADTYWDRIFFDEEYNTSLFKERLKFPVWKATVKRNDDSVLERTIEVAPPVGDVPGPVKKVLGDNFGYKEHGRFDRKTKRYHVDIESNVATEKTKIHGDIWLEKVADKKVRRLAAFRIEVKIMMVGGMIEDRIANDMTRDFTRGAEFTNEWIKSKGL